ATLAGVTVPAELANGLHRGTERAQQRAAFPSGAANRRLERVEGVIDASREVGKELVGALYLDRCQRRRARGIAADRVQVAEQRLHVALELFHDLLEPPGHAARGHH